MPRPKRVRLVNNPPKIKGFNPFGYYGSIKSPVQLFHEEYETIRLLDYEGMNQVDAATQMNISRPTLTRIYENARKKVALAFIEAKQIVIEGGQSIYKDAWFECSECYSRFNKPDKLAKTNPQCPVCSGTSVNSLKI